MSLEWSFRCPLPNGMHARPASFLEEKARQYQSSIHLLVERSGALIDTRSVLALISAGILKNDALQLQVSGEDEAEALAALQLFLEHELVKKDEPLVPVAEVNVSQKLSRSLQAAGPEKIIRGTPVSCGLGMGRLVTVARLTFQLQDVDVGTQSEEYAKFVEARDRLLLKGIHTSKNGVEADVLNAQAALMRDEALAAAVFKNLADSGTPAGRALVEVVESFQKKLTGTGNAYLQERVLDLQDVAAQLLAEMYGNSAVTALPKLTSPSVVVAEHLTPGQFLALNRQWLRGLILQQGGGTSHTVILARSFAIPTLVGVPEMANLHSGDAVILDADRGILLLTPNLTVQRFYALETRKHEAHRQTSAAFLNLPGQSADGRPLSILANVASAEEAVAAFEQGAQGIGLFRTEMLFMDRETAPTEDEQTLIYTAVLQAANGRPTTFRTLDIGGDKPVPYLQLPAEANPFLGCRGVRLYALKPELIRTQLRALCRASATAGPAKIMVPMITCPEEMIAFRTLVESIRSDFLGAKLEIGAMLEVPAAVFALPELAQHADFFSIGTNDLIQYFLAADRDHHGLGALYSAFHPAFLRFLTKLVEDCQTAGRPIGLCGELGESSAALPLLLGLGLDSISLGAPRIAATKAALAKLQSPECKTLLSEITALPDRAVVEQRLAAFSLASSDLPFLDPGLIVVNSEAASKHEVIKELTDLLELQGRVADGSEIEEVVWQREETYSTGFGHGFAVPHGKSEHLRANSIAVARLLKPVEWAALDGLPVRVVILLAIRASDQGKEHLRIFSKLSRLIMRDEFRASLVAASDALAIYAILQKEILS